MARTNSFFQTSKLVSLCLGPYLELFTKSVVFRQKAPESSQNDERFYENSTSLDLDC